MCGRYALGIRASFVRYQLQNQGLPVDDAPPDDAARETYNFPPGAYGLVYRAQVPDTGVRDGDEPPTDIDIPNDNNNLDDDHDTTPPTTSPKHASSNHHTLTRPNPSYTYELRAMKWGLIPFWTKRSPDYTSMLRTINCRDDSLSQPSGLWTTMKARKRCIVIAQGFYEWLKRGPPGSKQEKIPHFVRRADERIMLFAGLWDCVRYDDDEDGKGAKGEGLYTYTVITTESNSQLSFLHDRMPVILEPGSEALRLWLDPSVNKWSDELQAVLKPYEGQLECYPVNKDVGKVGNNDPSFIIPVDSKENKKNIANFFDNARRKESPGKKKGEGGKDGVDALSLSEVRKEEEEGHEQDGDTRITKDHDGSENHAPLPVPPGSPGGVKRKADVGDEGNHGKTSKYFKTESTIADPESQNKSNVKSPGKTQYKSDTKLPSKPTVTPEKKAMDSSAKTVASAKSTSTTRKTRSATSNEGLSKKPSPVKTDGSQRITSFFGSKDGG